MGEAVTHMKKALRDACLAVSCLVATGIVCTPKSVAIFDLMAASAVGLFDEVAIFPWELSGEDIATAGLEIAQAVLPSGRLAMSWGDLKFR
jgi:hypothetical protein